MAIHIMNKRVQVLLDEEEREAFRKSAEQQGLSLSAWLREAGRARLAAARCGGIRSVEELRLFFFEIDKQEHGTEPDWEQHRDVIQRSRSSGGTST
ncbi:MAG: antitoxin VapB23 [Acidobacteriota bacterium]|nr:MAG: antitoxin VapB23 [Acidobacteriota bacterium]